MINPTKIDELYMSDSMTYSCNGCGHSGKITVQKFSTENWEEDYEMNKISCPNCGIELTIN